MMSRTRIFLIMTAALFCIGAVGQDFGWTLKFDGLFDNREYKNDMLPQTIYGMRVMPEVSIGRDMSRLNAGFSLISEFGARDDDPLTDLILYYTARKGKWTAHFGNIPRYHLMRQLPDAFLYDSIAFFEPMIGGTLFQYGNRRLTSELYCNWTGRQSETRRETFRIVWDGYIGSDIKGFGGGWFAALTHYAKPKEPGHYIYEKIQLNPYLSARYRSGDILLSADAGLLCSLVRCRKEENWHTPAGFLASLKAKWRIVDLSSTVYAGDSQQPFLNDPEAGLAFHRSDPFYNHSFYNRTGLGVRLFSDDHVDFSFRWNLHFTPDTPVHNQQLITVKFFTGSRKRSGRGG